MIPRLWDGLGGTEWVWSNGVGTCGGLGGCRMGPGLLGHRVDSRYLEWPWGRVAAGPTSKRVLREQRAGVNGGALQQEHPAVSRCRARGAGLPGAGVRGTGRGDRLPARPPGESPHVSPRPVAEMPTSCPQPPAPRAPFPRVPLLGAPATLLSASCGA